MIELAEFLEPKGTNLRVHHLAIDLDTNELTLHPVMVDKGQVPLSLVKCDLLLSVVGHPFCNSETGKL